MSIRSIAATLALLTAASAAPAWADTAPPAATLVLTAEAVVHARPDTAAIRAGVVTQQPSAAAAITDNAARMAQVTAALRRAGVAPRDIQTAQFALEPQYRYDKDQPPRLVGYQVSNQVRVLLRDIAAAGAVIDALAARGANQIEGPSLGVSDPEPLLDAARGQAVRDGIARARLYAAAAGLKVRRVLAIEETSASRPQPAPRMVAMMAEAKAATPVEGGEVPLAVSVMMRFELE